MRILLLHDNSILDRKSDVDIALEKIKTDYSEVAHVSWEYKDMDFSALRWVEYQPTFYGIAWDIVQKDMSAITKDKYDQVIYVISEEHWKAPGIGGWNLGTPINGFQVEIVRIYQPSNEWGRYATFAMEIAHSWDNLCRQEIGDNLLSTFAISDFDNGVIHGNDPRYGKLRPDGTYYTDYQYAPMIAMVKDKLKNAFLLRKTRYENPPIFIFNKNLYFGMRNDGVWHLQKRVIAEGLANYEATGYFGKLTLASAKNYQIKHGITPAWGYVGKKTRAVLNTTTSATPLPVHLEELELYNR